MIYYKNDCNYFDYEVEDVIKLFYLPDEIKKTAEPWDNSSEAFVLLYKDIRQGEEYLNILLKAPDFKYSTAIPCEGIFESSDRIEVKNFKRILKRKLFKILEKYTNKTIPWGILTGIRPVKLANEFIDVGMDKEQIINVLKTDYFVTENKADLLFEVADNQRKLFINSKPNSVSLYIGIPFCPSRCLYCSFSSSTIGQYKNMTGTYVDILLGEIKETAKLIAAQKLEVESIYIGGGTPTSLSNEQLKKLLSGIENNIDMSTVKEYTIEAGRPDTINLEKLSTIKKSRVTRISINPQTMNIETLRRIGRKHTPEDIEEAFKTARELGFSNINMDLICGLPGETPEMFNNTLERVSILNPDSLTVHTMALKRASRLTEEMEKYDLYTQRAHVAQMVDKAREYARISGLYPYYLYRQKNILGNLENVGYSKKGKECLYNIQIMEERQTILACGAGAVTKAVFPSDRIERAFNVKSVEEYIGRINEMIERKWKVILGSK